MELTGDIPIVILAFFTAILFMAGLVHGTLGLGFPLVATPLLALFVDVRSAILITLLPTAAVNIASIVRGGHWSDSIGRFWPLGVYALIGGFAGSTLIVIGDPAPFKLVLAGLIMLYLGSGWLGNFRMAWVARNPGLSMLVFGLVAGVSAGSTNVMVPILIIYALEMGLQTTAMVQVFNMCFLAGKVSQIVVFTAAGMLTSKTLLLTVPLAAVALVALILGMTFRGRISGDAFRTIIKWVLFVIALVLIGQYFYGP
jgi:uncharacterized membrane protein YfcA